MRYSVIAAAAAALATPAVAAPLTFQHDNVRYTYTVADKGDAQVVAGVSSEGSNYHLVVRRGVVSGTVNDQPVRFRVAEATGSVSVETAAR